MAIDLEQPREFLTASRESFAEGIGGSDDLEFLSVGTTAATVSANPLEVLFESWHVKHQASKLVSYAGLCNDSGWGFYSNLVAIRMLRAYGFSKASDPAANHAAQEVIAHCMEKIAGPNMLDGPAYAERLREARGKDGPVLPDDLEKIEEEFSEDLYSIVPKIKSLIVALTQAEPILGKDLGHLKWRLAELQNVILRESSIDQHRRELAV